MPNGGDIYLLPNGTLRNKLGLTDQGELQQAENRITAARGALPERDLLGQPHPFRPTAKCRHWTGFVPQTGTMGR